MAMLLMVGGADEGDCAHGPCGLGGVTSVEGDLVLGPLEAPGGLHPREDGVDLSRDLLEVAVGEGGLCPAEDARDVGLGLLVAPSVFLGMLLTSLAGVLHGSVQDRKTHV